MSQHYPEPVYETPDIAAMNIVQTGTEADLVQLMVTQYQRKRPSWTPHAGSPEVMLFEVFASVLTGEIAAVNNVGYQVVQQLLAYDGVYPDDGAYASTRVRFDTQSSLNPITIPAGTRLRLSVDSSLGETVDLLTEEPVTIYPDSQNTIGYASAVAEYVGSSANGTPAGTPLELIANVPLVNTVTLEVPLLGGRDPENREDFAARAEMARSAFNGTPGRPESFHAFALRDPAVGRAHILDRHDPASPNQLTTGHVTVVVTDQVGQPLTGTAIAALRSDIVDNAMSSLHIHVLAPTYTTVDLSVTVRVHPGYDPDVVAASVNQALQRWLSPTTWDWSKQITPYMVVGVVSPITGVAEVITAPNPITLNGAAPLPLAGSITVLTQE